MRNNNIHSGSCIRLLWVVLVECVWLLERSVPNSNVCAAGDIQPQVITASSRGKPDSSEKFIADRIHIIMATTQQQQHMAEE